MPYIETKDVKEMRQRIRKALPDFKVSVTRENHSSVRVTLLKGPVDFGGDNLNVNHFHYQTHFEDNPEAVEVFDTIMKSIDGVKQEHEIVYDSDYGSVPNFYRNISVGKWDKSYELTS